MRSYHIVAMIIAGLIFLLATEDADSFTVNRPRGGPIKVAPSAQPTSGLPYIAQPETPKTTSPEDYINSGGNPGGSGNNAPSTAPASKTSAPLPSPTPYQKSKSKFPAFILIFSLLCVFGVLVWYCTRNINLKRMFK